ncbi:MAG: translocation/assembly module TamB domain-containing protein [Gemmatimonadales bacterium]
MRGVRWTIGILGAVLLLVAVSVWFALSNEWAAQRLLAEAVKRTPALVRVGRVSGPLAGPLELRDVVVRTEAMSARVDRLLLEWRPAGLFRRRVEIERLHLSGVRVVLPDSVPESPDTLPGSRQRIHLPVEVQLGDVRLERVTVDAPGGLKLRDGTLTVEGRARDYAFQLAGAISTPAVQEIKVRAAARGDLDRLTLDSATASLLDGKVTAAGAVRWWPEIGWQLALAGRGLRPAPLAPDSAAWPGAISFRAATEGVLDSAGPVGRVVLDTLTGDLRGQPLGGALTVQASGDRYAIPRLVLTWGAVRLAAAGVIGDLLDLSFELSASRLGLVLPGAAGSLSLRGTATGPRDSAQIQTTFSGRGLRYQENRLARLNGRADLGLAPNGRTDLDLRGENAEVSGRRIQRVMVVARGTRNRHRVRARVEAPEASLRLALDGGIGEDSTWNGAIGALDITSAEVGEWRLVSAVPVSAGSATVQLDQLCLRSGEVTRFCAAGAWHKSGSWRAASRLKEVPLSLAAAFLPEGWSVEGTLDGSAVASATASGRLEAHVTLQPAEAVLGYVADSVTHRMALDRGELELKAGRQGVRGRLTVELSGDDRAPIGVLNATAELPDYTRLGQTIARQRVTGRLEARLPDLSSLRPFADSLETLSGSVSLNLAAKGTVGSPKIEGRLSTSQLSVRHQAGWAARGSLAAGLEAEVAADRSLTGEVRIRPRDVVLELPGDTLVRTIGLDTGSVDLRAGASGVVGEIILALTERGGRPLGTVSGELALPEYTRLGETLTLQPVRVRLEGRLPDLGAFLEVAPAGALTALSGSADLDLRVDGSVGAPEVSGRLRVRDARATHARGWSAAGSLAADLDAALGRDSAMSGELRILPLGATFEYPGDRGRQRLTVDTGSVHLRAGPGGVRGTLALRLADRGGKTVGWMDGAVALPGYRKLGQAAEGQALAADLQGRLDDLSFVEAVTDRVDSLAGRVTVDLNVDGTLAQPRVTGGLAFHDGAAKLPALGLRLRELQLEAKGDRGGVIALSGGARSGPGRLVLEGTWPLDASTESPARLTIRGERFEAVDLPEARVLVSPRLDVALTGKRVEVKGEVGVPFARIALAEIPATAVPVSDDVVFVDSTATPTPVLDIATQVRVVLGDSVSFKGFNFTADLGGSLLAIERPGSPPTATGELVIEQGRYKAYGQDLSISQGRVRFGGGPVDDPGLDIRATRTADDGVVAGLDIAGTLKAPEVTIFSEPPMAQSEALAYIVLGHPLGESGSSENSTLLAQAAQSLGLRGGNLLVRTLGRGVGLDEARIETEGDLSEASFVAGKYLSPNLYVSYGIGLFDPVSTLRLRYVLSSHWTLQAETGTATGTDLLYRIEAGR